VNAVVNQIAVESDDDVARVRILVADDCGTNRLVMKAMLEHDGYEVFLAENGQQAIELFEQECPDLILMDNHMPVIDGYEATRLIKARSCGDFVPIILLAVLSDQDSLVKAIESGGDDILGKPYNRAILSAKIRSLVRVRELYEVQRKQTVELSTYNEQQRRDQMVAEKIFNNIVRSGTLDLTNLRYIVSPMAVFNGDLLLAAATPAGGLHVMVGDFTGHGLAAALGAMPSSEIFYGMTSKGFSIVDIAHEINKKLRLMLPTGMFLATALVEIESSWQSASVWNAGVPDILIRGQDTGIKNRVPSEHLPLGVVNSGEIDGAITRVELAEGDRIFVYTDGVIESRDIEGELFGQKRLDDTVSDHLDASKVFDEITQRLNCFQGDSAQDDDITLIEIVCDPSAVAGLKVAEEEPKKALPPISWKVGLQLQADSMRTTNPLPLLIQMVMEIQGLYDHRERLYTVLSELYSNALDHGLLGLDSKLKQTPDGFMAYYTQRESRLAELEDQSIDLELEHIPHGTGGKLILRMKDTGPGFDMATKRTTLDDNAGHSGRGIALVTTLCVELNHYGNGNQAEAVYIWE